MKRYEVSGTDRALGAYGMHEPFKTTVEARDIWDAQAKVRAKRSITRKDILIMKAIIQD